jgi:dihydroorotase
MTANAGQDEPYDLALAGGMVIDPASGRHEVADVTVSGGKVAAISAEPVRRARRTIDCRGAFITPGLIDYHVHVFESVSTLGAPVEEACLRRGVTAAADAGSAGAWTFAAFERYVVRTAPIPVYCFLNISGMGILDRDAGELRVLSYVDVDAAVETAARHPEIIKGFKVRVGEHVIGGSCLPVLERARAIGDRSGLPLMVHIGDSKEPLPQVLSYLRPGDVISHCYTGLNHGIIDQIGILPAVRMAREEGVKFDPAHGSSNFTFGVARRALDLGFLPDTISSDNSLRNWRGPVYDLATTMSKFLALGMTIDQVVERATIGPARLLGIDASGAGGIAPGSPADVTVLRLTDEPCELRDAAGETILARRLEPDYVVRAGQAQRCAPWRGAQAGQIGAR